MFLTLIIFTTLIIHLLNVTSTIGWIFIKRKSFFSIPISDIIYSGKLDEIFSLIDNDDVGDSDEDSDIKEHT